MHLLVITQKVDKDDPILGFFHHWLQKLAQRFDSLTVIALGVGRYDLPSQVKVLSLGKESGLGRWAYLKNFFRYINQERKNYDVVWVHMNPEYVVLGGLCWKIWGKKIALWYNHAHGSYWSKIAVKLADKVFYTSPFAFMSRYRKAKIMPVGIDTDIFQNRHNKKQDSIFRILSLGRVSPVKKIDQLIMAIKQLKDLNLEINIYGEAPARDQGYYDKIKEWAKDLRQIHFYPSVTNQQTPEIYSQHDLFINLTPSGSFDKTILEAMACESLVLFCNQSLAAALPPEFLFVENNVNDLAAKIRKIMTLNKEEYTIRFRKYVVEHHSLEALLAKLSAELTWNRN